MAKTTSTAKAQPPAKAGDPDAKALLGRAQQGDTKAMESLRGVLSERLGARWEMELTGPADALRDTLLKVELGHDLLSREAWARRAKTLQRDLEGPAPTPLERILCERGALCWLQAHLADLRDANVDAGGSTLTKAEYYSRRAERAQRRYLDATLALARVRRLLAPVVAQVNIAQSGAQQLNITAPAQPTPQPTLASTTPVARRGEDDAPAGAS